MSTCSVYILARRGVRASRHAWTISRHARVISRFARGGVRAFSHVAHIDEIDMSGLDKVDNRDSQPITCRLIAFFFFWYITLRRDLDLWLLTLNICGIPVYRLCRSLTLYQIYTQSSNPRMKCDFNIWPNDLEHVSLSRAMFCYWIIFTKFELDQPSTITYPFLNCSIFLLRIRYVILWHWPLTPGLWRDQTLYPV